MRKIITLIVGALICTMGFAQQPEAVFKKASVEPFIDGVIDDVWAEANEYNIDLNFGEEAPTLGAAGETTWKGLWTDDGIFVLLTVTDDEFYPSYLVAGSNHWDYDKPEIYFDVNPTLVDGVGGGGGNGHYQFAPAFTADNIDGTAFEDNGVTVAYLVTAPNYVTEYFVPFTKLLDKDGFALDQTGTFGFDVTIIDRETGDGARKRAVWANIGTVAESYANMDECGLATLDGAAEAILLESIELTGDNTITTDNGTIQLNIALLPEDATNKNLSWSVDVESTGSAKVDSGLVTAVKDGTVTIRAEATDGSFMDATFDITISGQVISKDEINVIRNANFDDATDEWGGWIDGGWGEPHAVVDGVATLVPSQASDAGETWHYQFNQNQLTADANVAYVLMFKAWASVARGLNFDFEDTAGNGYNRYGTSADANATDGGSEWNIDLTTDPTWFTQHVTFDKMVDNTDQKIQFMISHELGTVYLDSIFLAKESDLALVSAIRKTRANTAMSVYPNPVNGSDVLYVQVEALNREVSIHNILGHEVLKQVANGKIATFDVASLPKGIYFVRLSDGSSKSFIR